MDFQVGDKVRVATCVFNKEYLIDKIGTVIDVIDNPGLICGKEIIVNIEELDENIRGEWSFISNELDKI